MVRFIGKLPPGFSPYVSKSRRPNETTSLHDEEKNQIFFPKLPEAAPTELTLMERLTNTLLGKIDEQPTSECERIEAELIAEVERNG